VADQFNLTESKVKAIIKSYNKLNPDTEKPNTKMTVERVKKEMDPFNQLTLETEYYREKLAYWSNLLEEAKLKASYYKTKWMIIAKMSS